MLPSELESRMLCTDYVLLAAAESIEPRGEVRADLRAGIAAAAAANPWRPKNRQPYKPIDFMPKFGSQKKQRQSPAEMKAILREYTLRLGGTVTGKRKAIGH